MASPSASASPSVTPSSASLSTNKESRIVSLKLKPELLSRLANAEGQDHTSRFSNQVNGRAPEASNTPDGVGFANSTAETTALEAPQNGDEKAASPSAASGTGNGDSPINAAPTVNGDAPVTSPPPSLIKSALKPGAKRSVTTDGSAKPKSRATIRKKVKLDEGDSFRRPNSSSGLLANGTGQPKVTGKSALSSAASRKLDRSGSKCRRWTRSTRPIKSFTGVAWGIVTWASPAPPVPDQQPGEAVAVDELTKDKTETTAASEETTAIETRGKDNEPDATVDEDKTHNSDNINNGINSKTKPKGASSKTPATPTAAKPKKGNNQQGKQRKPSGAGVGKDNSTTESEKSAEIAVAS